MAGHSSYASFKGGRNETSSHHHPTTEGSEPLRPTPSGSARRVRQLKHSASDDEEESLSFENEHFGSSREEDREMKELGKDKSMLIRLQRLDPALVYEMAICQKNHVDLTEFSVKVDKQSKSHDSQHVYMPFYAFKGSGERWKEIRKALYNLKEGRVWEGIELQKLILSYNSSYRFKWDFSGLLLFLRDLEGKPDCCETLGTLTKMAELALDIEKLMPMPIPFLKRGKSRSIALSKKQLACLLAHAFFCTYPMRNVDPHVKEKHYMTTESLPLPSINFSSLFKFNLPAMTASKLKCIFHYFRRVTARDYDGCKKVIFKRQVLKPSAVAWRQSKKRFTDLHVTSQGRIEAAEGLLQVDFANKFVGGGVIGRGCVQEEIWFLISPELIASRLFTEALEDNEVLIITGSEIYSQHKGYSSSFEWIGDYVDKTGSIKGVKLSQMVAMDAKKFHRDEDQFEMNVIERELNKAYCGFSCESRGNVDELPAVSTGNWGCGAFGGDKHLKSLIQMMAAAEAGRDVCYFTHGDTELVKKMFEVHSLIRLHNLTVGDVYQMIVNYVERLQYDRGFHYSSKLFEYILSTFAKVDTGLRRSPSEGTPV